MEIYIKTHTVQKGETLENIVSQYHISDIEMLRYFHNQNAPKDSNHLGKEIQEGQEVFIPSKLDIEKILRDRKEKGIEHYDSLKNKLLIPDISALHQHYKVKITYSLANNLENPESLEFDTYIKYLGVKDVHHPVLQYTKDYYLINNGMSGEKLYDLAVLGTDFLYPLEFSLDLETVNPHKITNIKEVKSRWNEKREKLKTYYKDSYSLRYIKTIDEAINEGFSKYFMNDFFIQFLFAPYAEFTEGKSVTEKYFHQYRIAYQQILDLEILEDSLQVNLEAYCIDKRTAQQILAKWRPSEQTQEDDNELVESDITGTYRLHKKNRTLQNASIRMSTLLYDEEEIIEIKIDVIP